MVSMGGSDVNAKGRRECCSLHLIKIFRFF